MKKILIPTDYSDISDYALNLANKVAKHTKAQIYALKVIGVSGEALFDTQGELIEGEDFDVSVPEAEREENIGRIKTWADKSDLPVKTTVKIGELQDQILRFIKNEQIDLVVMGSHGASGIKELIGASVAERLVKDAPVPVLTLKCDRSNITIKDIILATNFDQMASEKIAVFKELQKAFGAKLHLLKVNTPYDFTTTRRLIKQMEDFVKANRLKDTSFTVYCEETIADGITNFADDHGIDLIAIGTHGRSTISRLLKKSVSKSLVNHVAHPILTFEI